MTLPPPPWAVRQYFAHRRGTLSGLTAADIAFNEALWRDIVEGKPLRAATGIVSGAETDPDVSLPRAVRVTHSLGGECGECGRGFRPAREWSRFCSDACKMRAYRRRRGRQEGVVSGGG